MKRLQTLLIVTVLALAIYIVFTDIGDSKSHSSGAGDIWWTDTADIDQAYRSIVQKK